MNEVVIREQKKSWLPNLSSASLAGVLALLSVSVIVNGFVRLLMAMTEEGPLGGQEIDGLQIALTIGRVTGVAMLIFMYYTRHLVSVHRVLWLVLAAFELLVAGFIVYDISRIGEQSFFPYLSIVGGLVSVAFKLWGYSLATEEYNRDRNRAADEPRFENRAQLVLSRYLRPGLTSPALAFILSFIVLTHLMISAYMMFFAGEMYEHNSSYTFAPQYLLGVLFFIGACITTYLNPENGLLQRRAWIICIIFSLAFFIPLLSDFDNFSPYKISYFFTPLVILFLSVRGYSLAKVDHDLRTRDPEEPVEDQYGSPTRKFYFLKPPFGITSSRLAGLSLLLYIPVFFFIFMEVAGFARYGRGSFEDRFALLFLIPFFLVLIGYMRIYHSPYAPEKHRGWWWYAIVINVIHMILWLLDAGDDYYPYTIPVTLLGILLFIALAGVNRSSFDDPYERRLP